MPRPFNRRQALENRAFLSALRRSGNVRLTRAARRTPLTFTKRRNKDAAFAAEWDAALAIAAASLLRPKRRTESEPQITRLKNGRLQLREAGAHKIGPGARQAFLAALSATANVRLAARATGFAHSSFYRLRDHDAGFAREMRLALQLGYDRIELALLQNMDPASCRDDGWRHNEPPPIPPMSVSQALQLMYLHQKEARLWGTRSDRRRKRGEPGWAWRARSGAQMARREGVGSRRL